MGSKDQPAVHKATLRAFIYLRTWERGPECYAHCERMGYRAGVVYDPDGTKFDELYGAMVRGEAEVIVVWSLADLPPDRVPRVEAVEAAPPEIPRQRRPRVVRRPRKADTGPD